MKKEVDGAAWGSGSDDKSVCRMRQHRRSRQAITQMVRRQRQYREKTAPEAGDAGRRAWQEAADTVIVADESFLGAGGGI